MGLELTAVNGCIVEVTTPLVIGAPPSVVSIPSTVDKAEGQGVFSDKLDVIISGLTLGACVQNAPVNASISATAENDFSENKKTMRKGDSESGISIDGMTTATPPVACKFSVDIEITDPGQSSTQGS